MIDPLIFWLSVSVVTTLFVYSYLIKPNIYFRIAEHLFIGVTAAVTLVFTMQTLWRNILEPIPRGNWVNLIPVILSIFLFLPYLAKVTNVKSLSRFNQIPMALVVAGAFAITARTAVDASFYTQITAAVNAFATRDVVLLFNAIVGLVAVFTSVSYFIYTREHKGILKTPSWVGRLVIMIYFGWTFGSLAATRMTLITGTVFSVIDSLQAIFKLLLQAL